MDMDRKISQRTSEGFQSYEYNYSCLQLIAIVRTERSLLPGIAGNHWSSSGTPAKSSGVPNNVNSELIFESKNQRYKITWLLAVTSYYCFYTAGIIVTL